MYDVSRLPNQYLDETNDGRQDCYEKSLSIDLYRKPRLDLREAIYSMGMSIRAERV
jgi:hypothetical protein